MNWFLTRLAFRQAAEVTVQGIVKNTAGSTR
jgi:hypothetical protein